MTVGHNSVAGDELRQFIERIERLEEEKRAIADDIKEVYGEAKARGFDTKTMRKIVALRRKNEEERAEEAAMLDLYMNALGMLADTPLGQAAVRRDCREEIAERLVGAAGAGELKSVSRIEMGDKVIYEREPQQVDLEEAIAASGKAVDDFPELPPHLDRRRSRAVAEAEA